MRHINPDEMSKPVRHLFELGLVRRLKPDVMAPFIGVTAPTVYNWFLGRKPWPEHEALILEGIKKIEAAYPEPETEEIRPGVFAAKAWWGRNPLLEAMEDPAVKEAKATVEKAEDEYYALMAEAKRGLGKRAAVEPSLATELDGIEADNRSNPNVWFSLTELLLAAKPEGLRLKDYTELLRAYLRAIGIVDVPKK